MNRSTSSGSHTRLPRNHDLASIDSLNMPEDPLSQLSRLTDPSNDTSAQKELSMAYNKGPPPPLSLNQDKNVPEQGQRAMSANLSPPESHTRLLSLLNREKRQAQDSQESSHLEYRETSSRPDLDVREASLRTQAQLRARLAAEKRFTAASGDRELKLISNS